MIKIKSSFSKSFGWGKWGDKKRNENEIFGCIAADYSIEGLCNRASEMVIPPSSHESRLMFSLWALRVEILTAVNQLSTSQHQHLLTLCHQLDAAALLTLRCSPEQVNRGEKKLLRDPQKYFLLRCFRASSPSSDSAKKKTIAKQLLMRNTFVQWRPLTLLPSFDSTTFRNIFPHIRQRAKKKKRNKTEAKS